MITAHEWDLIQNLVDILIIWMVVLILRIV